MSKNDVFIARLARGAVASTLAACLMPQSHTEGAPARGVANEATVTEQTTLPDQGTQETAESAVVLTMGEAPSEWDKNMEREFRKLALEEAEGTLRSEAATRLEELNCWRDRLLNPQPADEILLQIRRDRLLARMEEILNDYVEFQEATGKTRTAA